MGAEKISTNQPALSERIRTKGTWHMKYKAYSRSTSSSSYHTRCVSLERLCSPFSRCDPPGTSKSIPPRRGTLYVVRHVLHQIPCIPYFQSMALLPLGGRGRPYSLETQRQQRRFAPATPLARLSAVRLHTYSQSATLGSRGYKRSWLSLRLSVVIDWREHEADSKQSVSVLAPEA